MVSRVEFYMHRLEARLSGVPSLFYQLVPEVEANAGVMT